MVCLREFSFLWFVYLFTFLEIPIKDDVVIVLRNVTAQAVVFLQKADEFIGRAIVC